MNTRYPVSEPLAGLIVSYVAPLAPSNELPPLINTMQRYNAIATQEIACTLLGAREQSVPLADRQWKKHLDLAVHCFRDIMFADCLLKFHYEYDHEEQPYIDGAKLWTINPHDPHPFKQLCRNMTCLAQSGYLGRMLYRLPLWPTFSPRLLNTIQPTAEQLCYQLKACSIRITTEENANKIFYDTFGKSGVARPLYIRNFLEDCELNDQAQEHFRLPSPLSLHRFSYRLSTHLLALAWRIASVVLIILDIAIIALLAIPGGLYCQAKVAMCVFLNHIKIITALPVGILGPMISAGAIELNNPMVVKISVAALSFFFLGQIVGELLKNRKFQATSDRFTSKLEFLMDRIDNRIAKLLAPKDPVLYIHCWRQAPIARKRLNALWIQP